MATKKELLKLKEEATDLGITFLEDIKFEDLEKLVNDL